MLYVLSLLAFAFSVPVYSQVPAGSSIRMLRSLSGPSGKHVGTKFVLDEMRNRFVFPQDSSLTVYFEFQAPKGDYTLTAYWKDPQGRTAGISPDIKIQTVTNELNCYWVFMIDANRPSGVWTAEIRINGEPVGSHSFELTVPPPPKPPDADTPAPPKLDEIYRTAVQSLVWVYKLDKAGQRIDTSTGFVVGPGSVLTAFQSIDAAAGIEIEFANGAKFSTDEILAFHRLQDWALVKAETRGVPPLQIGKSDAAVIGGQSIVFGLGPGSSRTIGYIDISGRGVVPGFGERIYINRQLSPMAIGGPMVDPFGKVIGVIGGSLAPGMWLEHRNFAIDLAITSPRSGLISVTPIDGTVLQPKYAAAKLQDMLESGVLTPPLSKAPVFSFGAITDKISADYSYVSQTQFSRKSSEIIVYTIWEREGKVSKGVVSMSVYDAANRLRSKVEPESLSLPPQGKLPFLYKFSPANLEPGLYRIDLFWDGLPIWRASVAIIY
jgi:S1-C subfamily serine protease